MIYKIAHFLRDSLPWLWDGIDILNSYLFTIQFGKKIKKFKFSIDHSGYDLVSIKEVPTDKLVAFFAKQPKEAYTYFKLLLSDKTDVLSKISC